MKIKNLKITLDRKWWFESKVLNFIAKPKLLTARTITQFDRFGQARQRCQTLCKSNHMATSNIHCLKVHWRHTQTVVVALFNSSELVLFLICKHIIIQLSTHNTHTRLILCLAMVNSHLIIVLLYDRRRNHQPPRTADRQQLMAWGKSPTESRFGSSYPVRCQVLPVSHITGRHTLMVFWVGYMHEISCFIRAWRTSLDYPQSDHTRCRGFAGWLCAQVDAN